MYIEMIKHQVEISSPFKYLRQWGIRKCRRHPSISSFRQGSISAILVLFNVAICDTNWPRRVMMVGFAPCICKYRSFVLWVRALKDAKYPRIFVGPSTDFARPLSCLGR